VHQLLDFTQSRPLYGDIGPHVVVSPDS